MIDDGADPLADFQMLFQPYHGTYRTDEAVFRNRDGTQQLPELLTNGNALSKAGGSQGADLHLVSFDMPVVETPQEWKDLGYEIWNKALLVGKTKMYGVKGTWGFAQGGWPYRALDGTVWHMRAAKENSTTIGIYCSIATTAVGGPDPVLIAAFDAGIDLFTETTSGNWIGAFPFTAWTYQTYQDLTTRLPVVNFDPNDGAKAACMCYTKYTGASHVLEVSVAGGDLASGEPPTVTGSFIVTPATAQVNVAYVDPSVEIISGVGIYRFYSPYAVSEIPAMDSAWSGDAPYDIVEVAPYDGLHFAAKGNKTFTPKIDSTGVNWGDILGGTGSAYWQFTPPYENSETTVVSVGYTKTGAKKTIKYVRKEAITNPIGFTATVTNPYVGQYNVSSSTGPSGPWKTKAFSGIIQPLEQEIDFEYFYEKYEGFLRDGEKLSDACYGQSYRIQRSGYTLVCYDNVAYTHDPLTGETITDSPEIIFNDPATGINWAARLPDSPAPYGNSYYNCYGKVFPMGNGIGVGYWWPGSLIDVGQQQLLYCTPDYQGAFGHADLCYTIGEYPVPVNPDTGEVSSNIPVFF